MKKVGLTVLFLLFALMYSCNNDNTFKKYCDVSKKAADNSVETYDYHKLRYESPIYSGAKKSLKEFCEGN